MPVEKRGPIVVRSSSRRHNVYLLEAGALEELQEYVKNEREALLRVLVLCFITHHDRCSNYELSRQLSFGGAV
jgi:hypothetical protein